LIETHSDEEINVAFAMSSLPPQDCLYLNRTSYIIAKPVRTGNVKGEVTLLLDRLAAGDHSAEEALITRVYVELHRLAMSRLRTERLGHTLQATALVNEAYLRLCRNQEINWQNRTHFFCVAAGVMRRILVDYARQHNAQKRNEGVRTIPLDQAISITADQSETALEIDDMLRNLSVISPRQAQVVEMRFFGGLSEEEIAVSLGKSVRTIRRDWLMARAWLHEQLNRS
jgi:RNA polymerase sigma-70 factor, ECF subfamily